MTNLERTIVNAYELEHISPEMIAEDMSLSVTAVKESLLSHSSEFRKAVKADKQFFTNEDINRIALALQRIALDDSPESNKSAAVRAGIFLINEHKGRNDVRQVTNLQVNIQVIQERLKNMKSILQDEPIAIT